MSQIRAIHNSFQKALKSLLEKRKYMYIHYCSKASLNFEKKFNQFY